MLTEAEWTIIRKALQCVQMAHMVTQTADGIDDRETTIDALIRKIRALERGLTDTADGDTIEDRE